MLVVGCAGKRDGPDVGQNPSDRVPVEVQNGSSITLSVYVLVGNTEWLLGRVDPLRTTTMNLPGGVSGTVALAVRPSGSRQSGEQHVSERFAIATGQRVSWQLRAPVGTALPRISNISIFTCSANSGC
jgi:hypothetical protein